MKLFDKLAADQARQQHAASFERVREAYRGNLATEGFFDMFRGTEDGTYTDFHADFKRVREALSATEGKELKDNAKTVKLGFHAVAMCVDWNQPIDSAEQVVRELERLTAVMRDLTKYYVPAMTELWNRVIKEVVLPLSQLPADAQDPQLVEKFEHTHKPTLIEGMKHWFTEQRSPQRKAPPAQATPNFLGLWFMESTITRMSNLTPFRVSLDFCWDEHMQDARGHLAQRSDTLVKPYSRVEVISVLDALQKAVEARSELHVAMEKMMALRSLVNEPGQKFIQAFPHWQEKQHEWPAQTIYAALTTEDQMVDYDGMRHQAFKQIDRALHVVVKICEISLKRMG